MKYIKTKLATDWTRETSKLEKLIRTILFFIPRANPDYDDKMHLIKSWLIEFSETNGEFLPYREIGLDEFDNPIISGPNTRNYGFWYDTDMKYEDFDGTPISREEFEQKWEFFN